MSCHWCQRWYKYQPSLTVYRDLGGLETLRHERDAFHGIYFAGQHSLRMVSAA